MAVCKIHGCRERLQSEENLVRGREERRFTIGDADNNPFFQESHARGLEEEHTLAASLFADKNPTGSLVR